jgi:hypothetical protein
LGDVNELAADAILVVHFAFVLFVVGGLVLTWAGALLHWGWIRNVWFRAAHLAAICYVAAEGLLGVMCPLTVWEDALRGTTVGDGFVARWIHRLMFYELPESFFTVVYVAFAGIVLLTYCLVPPGRRKAREVQ